MLAVVGDPLGHRALRRSSSPRIASSGLHRRRRLEALVREEAVEADRDPEAAGHVEAPRAARRRPGGRRRPRGRPIADEHAERRHQHRDERDDPARRAGALADGCDGRAAGVRLGALVVLSPTSQRLGPGGAPRPSSVYEARPYTDEVSTTHHTWSDDGEGGRRRHAASPASERPTPSRARTTSRSSSATTRAGGHAHTVTLGAPAAGNSRSTPASWCTTSGTTRGSPASSASSACAVQDSEMSFSVVCERCRPRVLRRAPVVAAARASSAPASPRLLRRDRALPALGPRRAARSATRAAPSATTSRAEGYSRAFRDHYLVPFASALWSTAPAADARLPGAVRSALLREPRPAGVPPPPLAHGGRRQPALRRGHHAPLGRAACAWAPRCRAVTRDADGVEVRTADDAGHRFDASRDRHSRAPGAGDARRRRRRRARRARRLPHHAQPDGAPHRPRPCCRAASQRAGVVELSGGRLPRAVAAARR